MLSLFNLSMFAASIALLIIAISLIKRNGKETFKYVLIGFVFAGVDFVVEFSGTYIGDWAYNRSIYKILGLIPVELLLLFFSGGIITRYLWMTANKLKQSNNIKIHYNYILYTLILAGIIFTFRDIMKGNYHLFYILVPFAIWGVLNIKKENLEMSLILSVVVFVADLLIETVLIGHGSYSYKKGFSHTTPLAYSLILLGFFGVMEKLHKLDRFIDSKFVHLFVKKSVYKRRAQIKRLAKGLKGKLKRKIDEFNERS